MVGDAVDADRAAQAIALGLEGDQRLAGGAEFCGLDEPAEFVVAVLDIALAAARAAGTYHAEQAMFVADDGVGVGCGLIKAVGQRRLAGGVAEPDLFDAGAGHDSAIFADLFGPAFDTEDGAALGVVGPGREALGGTMLRCSALPCHTLRGEADAGKQGGMCRVFVVVVASDSARQVDANEVGEQAAGGGLTGSGCAGRGCSTAVAISKPPDGALNVGDAVEAVRVAFGGVAQDEAAPLRVGDFDEDAGKIAGEADEFAGGDFDLGEFALRVEVQAAAVAPGPDVFFAARGFMDRDLPVGGVVRRAHAGVLGVADEDDAGAVGLDDLQGVADDIQVGFITQAPATAEDAGRGPGVVFDLLTQTFLARNN